MLNHLRNKICTPGLIPSKGNTYSYTIETGHSFCLRGANYMATVDLFLFVYMFIKL